MAVTDIWRKDKDIPIPEYSIDGDAGMDIRSNVTTTVRPGNTVVIPTGIYLAIPKGFEIQIRPRSGISSKTKLRIANSPGTLDSNYRNEIGIIVDNIGEDDIVINRFDRIAQIVLKETPRLVFREVENLSDLGNTARLAGFGSTGVS